MTTARVVARGRVLKRSFDRRLDLVRHFPASHAGLMQHTHGHKRLVMAYVSTTGVRLTGMLKAILTDIQFWIPVGALAVGIALLAWLH
jgi:hypothetical protein